MSVLDTFYILFKTNAAEIKKATGEAEKSAKDFEQSLSVAQKTSQALGASFLDLTAAGVAAFGSIFTLGKIKDGILNATHYNAEIEKLTRLTGVSGTELSAWDAVVQKAGGSAGEFTSWLHDINSQYALAGMGDKVKNIIPQLLVLADEFKRMKDAGDTAGTLALGQRFGLSEGVILALQQGRTEVEKMLAAEEKLAPVTAQNAKDARDYEKSVVDLQRAWRNLFTELTPLLTTFVNGLAGMAAFASDVLHGNWRKILSWGKDNDAAAPAAGHGVAYPSNGAEPRGIRNNNPGNLRKWGDAPTDGGYARFGTMQEGLAAEQKQLKLYGGRGINTLQGIASTWAPSSENDTAAYIAALERDTGFKADQKLDMNNPDVLRKLANAINAHENGARYGSLIGDAKGAISAADQSGLGATSGPTQNNIQIDKIEIHTQATDADGIARALDDRLTNHFRTTAGNFADGVSH